MPAEPETHEQLEKERWELLRTIDAWTEKPMIVLAFVWLALLVVDFTQGLSPGLQNLSTFIWVLFVLDFLIGFVIAPIKLVYLRTNWLTAVSLMLPALRVLRALRALRALRLLRATRSLNMLRLVSSVNRSFRALGNTLRRRGLPYVVGLTALLIFAGAAGVYYYEQSEGGFENYWDALWWTGMLMTTMGADYFPKTPEGRLLTWLLAVYAFAIFGYITAAIASYFVGQDQGEQAQQQHAEQAALLGQEQRLLDEMAALRAELARLSATRPPGDRPGP